MSPNETGFAMTLTWLYEGTKYQRPLPPLNYTDVEVLEWWEGSDRAFVEFPAFKAKEDAVVTKWEDTTIHFMKCVGVLFTAWIIFDTDNLLLRLLGAVGMYMLLKSMVVHTNSKE